MCSEQQTGRIIGIMQPYFLPYIGYWQLMNYVDCFVIYDNIQYTKKGWINRNRYLKEGKADYFTVPVKKDSDYLNVVERQVAADFDRSRLLKRLLFHYRKAPYFEETAPVLEKILLFQEQNLFRYLYYSVCEIRSLLEIDTEIIISSQVEIDHSLKGQDKVIALNQALNGREYVNAIGGVKLYQQQEFEKHGIRLKFIEAEGIQYQQLGGIFVPSLSIIDVLFFNGVLKSRKFLDAYKIIE